MLSLNGNIERAKQKVHQSSQRDFLFLDDIFFDKKYLTELMYIFSFFPS